jgi:nitrogen PTS system EIIA component
MNKDAVVNLLDFLPESAVVIDLQSQSKKEVLKELVGVLSRAHKLKMPEAVLNALMEREELGSTGIGQGIAIPHGKSDTVEEVVAALGISKKGIDFDALDGENVYLFFLLVAPTDASGTHLKVLAKVSRLLKDKFFRQALRDAKVPEDVLKLIREENEYY